MVASVNGNGKSGITLLKFWAPWCAPCKTMASIVEAAVEKRNSIHLKNINVDEDPDQAVEHGIRSIPTLVIMKDGSPTGKLVGARSLKEIECFLSEYAV